VSRLIDNDQIEVNTFAGSIEYMSPEVKDYDTYSYNTDCWSLGCVLYELITLEKFYDKGIKENDYIQNEIKTLKTSLLFKNLLSMMLQVNRENRVESYQIRLHRGSDSI